MQEPLSLRVKWQDGLKILLSICLEGTADIDVYIDLLLSAT